MVVDLPQLLFSPRRDKDTFHITMLNQLSLLMNRETMLGLITKLIRLMRLNGKLTSPLLVLIILILLKLQMRKSNLMKLKLHLLFKEREKPIQLVTAHLTSPHTPKETMLGTMPSTINPTR
jgi:hypothetical protein